ncbi:MAG: TIR domain-containing protein [Gammaproteobacteria bacterium]|nr:TIR domain-containing protein [Gammaproteobacteria bacterium]
MPIHKEFIAESLCQPPDAAAEVFLSYSRADADFARRLNDALQFHGKTTWFDQESIASGADFQQEIFRGIKDANNFLFIISPDSVHSPYCDGETEYAQKLGKRFVTVLHRAVPPEDLHSALAKVQWIDFNRHEGDFYANFSELARTLDTDRGHVRQHTKWLHRAMDWQEKGYGADLLLRGNEFALAENWLREAEEGKKQPEPTKIQKQFITESNAAIQAGIKREKQIAFLLKSLLAGVSIALLLAIGLGWYAYEQRDLAVAARDTAVFRQLSAQALLAAEVPNLVHGYFDKALLLTVQAFRMNDNMESRRNLLHVLQSNPKPDIYLRGHSDEILSVAVSPDGKTLASAGKDGKVILWDIEKHISAGELLSGKRAPLWKTAFSPDGKILAAASDDHTIKLWDVGQKVPAGVLQGHAGAVKDVAFSPDGKILASASDDGNIILWDAARQDFGIDAKIRGHEGGVWRLAFSPDGKILASGGKDEYVRLWDMVQRTSAGSPLQRENGKEINALAFSPNGKILAGGDMAGAITFWNTEQWKPVDENIHFSVYSMAFSADGKTLAIANYDGSLVLWDMEKKKRLGDPLRGHGDGITGIVFMPNGKLATGSKDKSVILWNPARQTRIGKFFRVEASMGGINEVAVSPDGRILAGSTDGKQVFLWDIERQMLSGKPLQGHTDEVYGVAFSPDGKILASGSKDKNIILWDAARQEPVGQALQGHEDLVWSVDFSPDGRILASGSSDNTVRLWDTALHLPVGQPLRAHKHWVYCVAFSPDGKLLASGSRDNTVILWDVARRAPIGDPLRAHKGRVTTLAFSPDGRILASAGYDETVILWDVALRKPLGKPLRGHGDLIFSIAFSPDGRILASGSWDNTIMLWNVAQRKSMGILHGHHS